MLISYWNTIRELKERFPSSQLSDMVLMTVKVKPTYYDRSQLRSIVYAIKLIKNY